MDPCGGSFYTASAGCRYSELSGALCEREGHQPSQRCGLSGVEHGRYSRFAGPRLFSTNPTKVSPLVDQEPPTCAPNPEQIYGQDCRYEVDDRLADEQSVMCAITRNDDVPSITARVDPPEPSAFYGFTKSNLLQGTDPSTRSVMTAEPPVTRRKPRDQIGVLKHMERHAAGRAMCLWLNGDGHECGCFLPVTR